MIALPLSAPELDWLIPCDHSVTTLAVPAHRDRNASRSPGARPVASAVRARSQARAERRASGRPSVCVST